MTDARIVVDADLGRVDSKTRKTKQGFREVGEEASKVGNSIGRWPAELGRAALKLTSVMTALNAINSEMESSRTKAVEASKTVGGGALERENSLAALGIKNPGAFNAGLRGMDAVASDASTTSFIDQLAEFKRSKKGSKLTESQIASAIRLQMDGVVGGGEIVKSLENGSFSALQQEAARRKSGYSDAALTERGQRQRERRSGIIAEDARAPGGRVYREAERHLDQYDATSMDGGIGRRIAYSLPFGVGEGMRAIDVKLLEVLGKIAVNTEASAAGKPSLGTTPEGGP